MEYFKQRFIEELNDEGDIEIRGITWKRHDALKLLDDSAEGELFNEWVNQTIEESKERALSFLAENGCLDRFRSLYRLHKQTNIIPFVGAGMSIDSGGLRWGDFLKSLLSDSPESLPTVEDFLTAQDYESAAQFVADTLGMPVFNEEIRSKLGVGCLGTIGPINLMPALFENGVITTNFDYVLYRAFENGDVPFKSELCGYELKEAPRRIANEPHCLLRLHGSAESSVGRILTKSEYEANYEDNSQLADVLDKLIGTRGFLFLGCSLDTDRTYYALCQLKERAQAEPTPHYAFLPLSEKDNRLIRRKFLAAAGIHPIYYPDGEDSQSIEDLLISMLQGGV
ncbi:SIR2 family protein [Halomonas sp. M1]|uniref:SIR2 family NAD-dependent protein deacylase n=1 Tax=Halomonas sp. M1 TaxID=3035470 RepID=UPI002485CEB3|nr:SIR2 family protein [Halomonas sp. M1]WFE70651.1 SIR2 family protein [Halomonas sp. M1]